MSRKPEEEREGHAEKQAGDDREVESGAFAAMDDVAGQPAEVKRKFPAEIKKSAQNDEKSPENEDGAAEFAKGVHGRILPQAATSPSVTASII